MTERGSRRGAANLAPILMILSFAAMGGLLWWLSATAVGTEPVVMEEEETEVDTAEAGAMVLTPEELDAGAATMVGQRVRIEEVGLSTRVGDNAFMVELGEPQQSSPFLVVPDSTLRAGGWSLPGGPLTVTGHVRERTDSILDAWVETGVIPAAQRPIAEFSSYFIEAIRVRGPRGGGGGGSDGAG